MFYTIYDAIVFKAEKNGIKEEEVEKNLEKEVSRQRDLDF